MSITQQIEALRAEIKSIRHRIKELQYQEQQLRNQWCDQLPVDEFLPCRLGHSASKDLFVACVLNDATNDIHTFIIPTTELKDLDEAAPDPMTQPQTPTSKSADPAREAGPQPS